MTREEAEKEIEKAFEPAFAKNIITALTEGATVSDKALEQEPILNKIRAEIEQLRLHKAQFLTNDNKVCIDSQAVLDILDKYKRESEDKE